MWSCTATDLRAWDSTSWTPSSKRLACDSWFTVEMKVPQTMSATSPTTCSQSPHSLSQVITDAEQRRIAADAEAMQVRKAAKEERDKEMQSLVDRIRKTAEERVHAAMRTKGLEPPPPSKPAVKKAGKARVSRKKVYDNAVRAKRVRIFPTPEQTKTMNDWFGGVRFVYNQLVERHTNVNRVVKLSELRGAVKQAKQKHAWLKDLPGEVIDTAVRDMDKARKAHFAKARKAKQMDPNADVRAKFRFRSKRDKQQSFELRARDWGRKKGLFAPLFTSGVMKGAEGELPVALEAACRVIRDRMGRFYLSLPRQVEARDESQAPKSRHGVVALDPGVRTFQTTYDADGVATEWGKNDMRQVFKLCLEANRLYSRSGSAPGHRQRRRRMLAWHRLLVRIKDLVGELHKKMATWLCENYRVVLIPKFGSSRMVRKAERKIRGKTARQMLCWGHFAFRQRLIAKAELFPWVKVIECDEAYTSKTCGHCGAINDKLGASKTFRCRACGQISDRDIHAARNILIRFLTRHPFVGVCEGPASG